MFFQHFLQQKKSQNNTLNNQFKIQYKKIKKSRSKKNSLKVLFLAPQPFYQDRGTPIANDLMLQVLSERGEQVDVVAYPEGRLVEYGENIRLYRTKYLPFVRNLRPGFSWKKLFYDFFIIIKVISLVSKKRYNLVHAVEETVFIALSLKVLLKIPYIYDMDSSLAQQMVEKYPFIEKIKLSKVFRFFEFFAVKNAQVVVPVCQAIADDIADAKPKKIALLPDISLLKSENKNNKLNLKTQLKIGNLMVMYVGNLERYQGIDLLLESLALALKETDQLDLVIVGGKCEDIQKYQQKANSLGISGQVHFLGQKPASELGTYLYQADILVSPRTKGKNTPMKIYSYLDSGKPLLATNLPTHTQVLNQDNSMLAEATPEDFSQKMICLINDPQLRLKLGLAGKMLIQEKHSYNAYSQKVNKLYDWLKAEILETEDIEIEPTATYEASKRNVL